MLMYFYSNPLYMCYVSRLFFSSATINNTSWDSSVSHLILVEYCIISSTELFHHGDKVVMEDNRGLCFDPALAKYLIYRKHHFQLLSKKAHLSYLNHMKLALFPQVHPTCWHKLAPKNQITVVVKHSR